MAICLPSAHAGGGILVSHDGVGKRFDCPIDQTLFASWYFNSSYEMLEITAGSRLVLEYEIVQHPPHAPPSAARLNGHSLVFLEALNAWTTQKIVEDSPKALVYLLGNRYADDAGTSLPGLEGVDKTKALALQQWLRDSNLGLSLLLASTEPMRHGPPSHDPSIRLIKQEEVGNSVIDTIKTLERQLKRVADLSGNVLVVDVDIEEDCVLNETASTNNNCATTDIPSSQVKSCFGDAVSRTSLSAMCKLTAGRFSYLSTPGFLWTSFYGLTSIPLRIASRTSTRYSTLCCVSYSKRRTI